MEETYNNAPGKEAAEGEKGCQRRGRAKKFGFAGSAAWGIKGNWTGDGKRKRWRKGEKGTHREETSVNEKPGKTKERGSSR